ncbi:MAG: hypothetical protein IIB08_02140 [Bacteroidetes bacterium]|nr:hypothetical protein [Bacteroidota bacterium]
MKPLVCIYCEGNDTKLAIVHKENETDKVKVLRIASISVTKSAVKIESEATAFNLDDESLQLEGMDGEIESFETDHAETAINNMQKALAGLNANKYLFIPALTEPSIYYHLYEGPRSPKPVKLKQSIIE